MITRLTSGGGSAATTIDNASGDNDGPGLPVMVAVAVAAYLGFKVLM